MRDPGYSFCIIAGGRRYHKLQQLIDSIHRQRIHTYEIIVVGDADDRPDVIYVPMKDAAKAGRTNLLRDTAGQRSKYDCIVFLDDDIILTPSWFEGVSRIASTSDLIATQLLNLDGTRHWDWSTVGGPRGHALLEYKDSDVFAYLPGGLTVVHACVWETVRWDSNLGYGQKEDVVFSRTAFMKGFTCRLCIESIGIHNDERYTQIGRMNARRSDEGAALWLADGLRDMTLDQLMVRAGRELVKKRLPEAVDCLRYALYKEPSFQPAQWQLSALESWCGGSVEGGRWHPKPITVLYGV
jgi:hypothetical protein